MGREERDGIVADFDEARGLGVIREDDGTEHPFHCTEIADGTRTIPIGVRVRFRVEWRVLRTEATDVRLAPSPTDAAF
jgi:cold shock CspA family protein